MSTDLELELFFFFHIRLDDMAQLQDSPTEEGCEDTYQDGRLCYNPSYTSVITEIEMKMMQSLENYERSIQSRIKQIDQHLTNETQLYQQYCSTIEHQFKEYADTITTKLHQLLQNINNRKHELLNELKDLFNHSTNTQNNYLKSLKEEQSKVEQTKTKYHSNISNFDVTSISDMTRRSNINSEMIENVLNNDISLHKFNNLPFTVAQCDIEFAAKSNHINKILESAFAEIESSVCKSGKIEPSFLYYSPLLDTNKTITITTPTIIQSNIKHNLNNLNIKLIKGASITVPSWNKTTNKGGKLEILCNSLTLHAGSEINVNGKGYKGGQPQHQGYSYKNIIPIVSRMSNYGGGGAGLKRYTDTKFGAGGGYGTDGANGGSTNGGACGGKAYGNKELNPPYLGSGGGGSISCGGTNGGGIVIIKCKQNIKIEKGATITANGGIANAYTNHDHDVENEYKIGKTQNDSNYSYKKHNGDSKFAGGGSGGSIHLKAPKIENYGIISSIGDTPHKWACPGGVGRIRFDCKKENVKFFQNMLFYHGKIEPTIGCLSFM